MCFGETHSISINMFMGIESRLFLEEEVRLIGEMIVLAEKP